MTTIISPLPNNFVNGTVADATQVDANFNQVVANVNANAAGNGANADITSLSALSTPLSVVQGGTGRNTLAASVPLVGNGTGALSVSGLTTVTNSLAVNVTIGAGYSDGPSCAQGTSGTWFASGTVTIQNNNAGGADAFEIKLWDGTTVIVSTMCHTPTNGFTLTASLSGVLATPAGNIRISVKDASNTSGFILAALTDTTVRASTLTVVRIG